MASIDRLASVTIELGTTAIAGKSFSDLMILGRHSLASRVMVITDSNDLLDLGLASTDPLYLAAVAAFSQVSHISQIYIGKIDGTETITAALASCAKENNNWYGLALASRVEDEVLLAAAWAEANQKLFITASSDEKILSAAQKTDLASKLKAKNYFRTALIYSHKAAEEFPEVAWMSYCFTFYPGAETWANKKLSGVSFSPLTETEFTTLKAKGVSSFENFNNSFAITQGGRVIGGEWIDIIRFRDWLVQDIQINVTYTLINTYGKVPYTDSGIELIGQAVRKSLDLGIVRGGIAPLEYDDEQNEIPSYIISLPRSANVSDNNKANRVLQDVKFKARLAGAIHLAEIKGSLAYSM